MRACRAPANEHCWKTQSTKAPEAVYSFCTILICCLTAVAG
jgi:hypothetical protein